MPRLSSLLRHCLLLTTASIIGVGTATASPLLRYELSATIPLSGQALKSFDISFVDPITGTYYFADRSNAGVDIINPTTFTQIGRATGFVGFTGTNATSGPDGVVVVNNGTTATLYAGDGNSTLRAFDVTNPTAPVAVGTTNTNGGAFRLDEMAYSPAHNTIFAANNANSPAYGNLINATTPISNASLQNSPILVPGQVASGGMEQPVWNPNTGTWFVSIPSFNGTDAGGVSQFTFDGTFINSYNFSSMGIGACAASGLGLGSNGNLLVGCSNGPPVVLNPTTGTANQLATAAGADELYYNPTDNTFAVTGALANGDRVIDVLNGSTYALIQEINLTSMGFGHGNAHSVAINPLNGEIFVPIPAGSGDTACLNGCVAAFDSVPEPSSLILLGSSLLLLFGLRRRKRSLGAGV
jgi:hypothetical protein